MFKCIFPFVCSLDANNASSSWDKAAGKVFSVTSGDLAQVSCTCTLLDWVMILGQGGEHIIIQNKKQYDIICKSVVIKYLADSK